MKNKNKKTIWFSIIAFSILFLSACGSLGPDEPAQDPNLVFTQVAETVMVSMTQTAEAMPATQMPEPTAVVAPTQQMEAPTPFPTQALVPQPLGPTPTIQRVGDAAKYNTQSPADNTTFKVNEDFAFHVCLGNIGTTDWDKGYYLEYVSGWQLWTNKTKFKVGDVVEPGGTWCFDLPSVAPYNPGDYITRWYFKNSDGDFLLEVYFNYKVKN